MTRIKKILMAMAAVFTVVCVSVTQIGAEAVYIVDGYSYNILTNTTIAICGWDNSSPEFIVPDTITGRKVVAIANTGLKGNQEITSVDFSHTTELASIGYQAFYGCQNISNDLIIPETVDNLSISAFEGCSSIPSVDIKGNVSTIPMQCFYQCESLTAVTLPESVTTIEKFAFANCTDLEFVALPRSVSSIATSSFKNDSNLTFGVYYGSYAYDYAKNRGNQYVLLDGVKLGDADGDGSVNVSDVTTIQRYLAELETLEGIYLHAADANQDGSVDISDATALQMYIAEYALPYPIGEAITQ